MPATSHALRALTKAECTVHGVIHSPLAFAMPRGACDCHVHVMGAPPRYPLDPGRVYAIEELPR